MYRPLDIDDMEAWKIDFSSQTVTHNSGLIVQLSPDALYGDKWSGRCLNARKWAEKDFEARAQHLPHMLRRAITVYEEGHKKACKQV